VDRSTKNLVDRSTKNLVDRSNIGEKKTGVAKKLKKWNCCYQESFSLDRPTEKKTKKLGGIKNNSTEILLTSRSSFF